ncbi:hypothetical protein [Flavobacterium sp. HJJ]|uniref:hypothetical protein n=1 Tax=Flavobacterium sp. HJJ TaxID=2783792 RepID=UPI00188ADA1C|nr:hypothetical protein [Flavobacterium sp. HJJ]MBF4473755.1 hypothetical protein [Flavobacterium sp. HJJ]
MLNNTTSDGVCTVYKYNSGLNSWVIIEIILPNVVIASNRDNYGILYFQWPVNHQKVFDYSTSLLYTYDVGSDSWSGKPTTASEAIEEKIDYTQLDPCPKEVFEQLKNASNLDIKDILEKLGAESQYTVNMVMESTDKNYAETQRISKYNYEIRVDRDRYEDGTKLFKATALIHEIIHAYFLSIVDDYNYTPSTALLTFPELFEAYVKKTYPNPDDADHKVMADKYADAMASALKEYDSNFSVPYQTVPDQVYKDLAWASLNEAPIFNKTFPPGSADNIRILNRYRAESSGHAVEQGTPNAQSPVGKPCN